MALSVYEIIQGIHQAQRNAFDGALEGGHSGTGEKVLVGLKREEGDPILDKRVIDGFKIATGGNLLKVFYQSEISLKEVHRNDFENEIVSRLNEVVKFLKKEFKKITKETLTLSPIMDEPHVKVQHLNQARTWVESYCIYEIGGIEKPEHPSQDAKERLEASMKMWMSQTPKR